MTLLESLNLTLGDVMPHFSLKNPEGLPFSSEDLMGKNGLFVIFTCNHCPYAVAIWPRVIKLARYASNLGIHCVAINPNINPDYPDDSPQKMNEKIKDWGIPFPYLVDEHQNVARSYHAQCTPDMYVLKSDHSLYYHGRFDDSWQDETKVTQEELKRALTCLSENSASPSPQSPSMGCSIKWLP